MTGVYLDHNATSPLRPAARAALVEALSDPQRLGNPSSAHRAGRRARRLLEDARERIAARLCAERDAVVFTSGGSEANALALTAGAPRPIVTTPVEHPSILAHLRQPDHAAAAGRLPIWLAVDGTGQVDGGVAEALDAWAGEAPALLSVALAHHETGVVRDVAGLGRGAHAAGLLAHTDASQAVGRIAVSFAELDVDLMTVCAHKFGGPPGIGALLVRPGTALEPLVRGGGQEGGLRAGTEPCLLATAFAAALDEALDERAELSVRWERERARLLALLRQLVPEVQLNSPANGGLPNTLNISFPGRDGQALVHRLDLEGVAVSHGSACASGSLEPSPALVRMTGDEDRARSAIRISFGWDTRDTDVDRFVAAVSVALRDVAPGATKRDA